MTLILAAVGIFLLAACGSLATRRSAALAPLLGAGGAVTGAVVGLTGVARVLTGSGCGVWQLAWGAYGTLHLGADALSALFLVPILALSALAAIYGVEYMGKGTDSVHDATTWFHFDVLVASMTLVVVARDALSFLVAWEVMALSSFFLVVHNGDRPEVREAGWVYLVATHLGTAALLALFVSMGASGGGLSFDALGRAASLAPSLAGLWFALAVVGFGTKAGFVPFHVWLPEAHPAAPSHVSALMSGVMIKTGVYGLARVISLLGPPPAWWGWLLVGVGLTSGVAGVALALAQHDLKRLLAYSSVENVGVIALGMGVGLLGWTHGSLPVMVAGFGGGLLHVVNHALFKGLLFLGAGAVQRATGTLELDRLGGLGKRMPWTAAAFLTGSLAICGLPPLNGFVSEVLIYFGALRAALASTPALVVPGALVAAGLGLIGALALACFAKAFGSIFLGEPRSQDLSTPRDPGPAMRAPLLALAAGCLALGVMPGLSVRALGPAITDLTRTPAPALVGALSGPQAWASSLSWAAALLALALAALLGTRAWLLAGREVREAGTWDCGYARPTARMQYTASSFAQPLTRVFHSLLRTRKEREAVAGLFPARASLVTHTGDVARAHGYDPLFRLATRALARLQPIQQGRVQMYVLYVLLALVGLLLWKVG